MRDGQVVIRRAPSPIVLWIAVALGCVVPAGRPAAAQGTSQPVILISIDGLRPDYVTGADRHRLSIPNLRRFVREGSYADGVIGVVPTVTYPSHATLVTGVWPATHGIHSNTTFDPLSKNQGGWYWYAEDLRVPTLWDAAAARGLTTANVHWPVTVGARVTYNLPQYWRTGMGDDRKLMRALATPTLLDTLERELGPYADGIDETIEGDERRARFAVRLLEMRRPALMMAYFTALDHTQHETGPFTPQAHATLERIDRIIGDLVSAAQRVYAGKAVIAVVSDHGFVRTTRSTNLIRAFVSAGLVTLGTEGKVASWKAIPWNAGASAAIIVRDSSDRVTRSAVGALLRKLASDTASGIARVIDAAELRSRGGFPEAAYVVGMRPGFIIGGSTTGPLVATVKPGGHHGYLPDVPEMRSAFFITGPGIPAGKSLGTIDMRAIAPTLAAILGVPLPTAQGKQLFP